MKSLAKHIDLNEKWTNYNCTRILGDKKGANKLLVQFIKEISQQKKSIVNQFCIEVCTQCLEKEGIAVNNGTYISNQAIRIQHPLFKNIIVPFLVEGYNNNDALVIRWIGQLEQYFHSDNITTNEFLNIINVEYPFDTVIFFEKSYELKQDQQTLELILNKICKGLDYATHELPIGILFEPKTFDIEIEKLQRYLNEFNTKSAYRKRLNKWMKIGEYWRNYIEDKDNYANFEIYLKLNKYILEE